MKKFYCILLVLTFLPFVIVDAQTEEGRCFIDRLFVSESGQKLPYKIMYPDNFDPSHSYPLVLFLHGAGERGSDNQKQIIHGRQRFSTDKDLNKAIFVAPQCPQEDYWVCIVRTNNLQEHSSRKFPFDAPISSSLLAVKELLDNIISLGFVDHDRVYGCGISMGAMGILDMTMRYPDFFAAVQPICGGVNLQRTHEYEGKTAFRFFHGLKDDIVLPKFSQDVCKILQDKEVESMIVEYPEANHNSWDSALAEPDFFTWMFSRNRNN